MQRQQSPNTPETQDPDLDAIEAFRAGAPGAFDLLVSRHQRRVFRLARRLLGDPEAALDAAQEVFVKAWRALPRFEGKARFTTWLTRITINQCRNELRKRGTVKHTRPTSLDEAVPGTEVSRVDTIASLEPEAPDRMAARDLAAAFETVMTSLDPEVREVLILKEVEELSYEGMAEVLDVPTGTVRSRLHRARAEVRRRMAGVLGRSA
ncbi:MAG: sigma-70 family RNA polymerase sigma factor [Planctomycetota bacterium]|nr:sigma-70 family RNA polymerase sigma factor [Planctomycetota bacterium]